jgi:hypothetical protein
VLAITEVRSRRRVQAAVRRHGAWAKVDARQPEPGRQPVEMDDEPNSPRGFAS